MKMPTLLRLATIPAAIAFATISPTHAIVIKDEVEPGGAISDGDNDIFDSFGRLVVNGEPYTGAVTELSASVFAVAPQVVSGLEVTGQVNGFEELGLSGGDPDFRFVRWWFQIRNPGVAPVSVTASLSGNLGSDGGTVLRASSTAGKFSAASVWCVTADDPGDAIGDPAFGFVQKSAVAASNPVVALLSIEDIASAYEFTLPPGKTVSLVWFGTARNVAGNGPGNIGSVADAVSDVTTILLDAAGNVNPQFLAGGLQSPAEAINHSAAAAANAIRIRVRKASRNRKGLVTAKGTADATFGVAEVNFRVAGLTGRTRGTNRWSFKTRAPGSITIRATDGLGNESSPTRVRIKR